MSKDKMDLIRTIVTVFIGLTLRRTFAIPTHENVTTNYLLEKTAMKTVQSVFTEMNIDVTTSTRSLVNDTVHTDGHTDSDHHSDEANCLVNKEECEPIVRRCGSRIFTMMVEDGDYDMELDESDPCRCVFHCFDHYGPACLSLRRQIRGHRRPHGDEHSVFKHLGELIGAFATGSVVGIFITLLIANLMTRCTRGSMESPREMRKLSGAGLNATLRAPMPSPIPATEGFYTEGPIGVTQSPKLPRVPSKTLYEDLDELAMNVNRTQNKESGPNMYFILDKDINVDRKDSESEEDADNMPSETNRPQRTSTSPDVVPEVRDDAAPHNEDVQNSKL